VGYLKVLTFSATAPQAVAGALVDMQREGAQQPGGLAGLIVDLRDNPGGIVEAGVDIAQVCEKMGVGGWAGGMGGGVWWGRGCPRTSCHDVCTDAGQTLSSRPAADHALGLIDEHI
jgi:hypothetical protein